MSFIFSLQIINFVLPDPNNVLWIVAPVATAAAAAVDANGIKTLLAKDLSIFLIKGNPVFSNGPKIPPKTPLDFCTLCNWVFDNFVLADEPFAKALRSLETCVLITYVGNYSYD